MDNYKCISVDWNNYHGITNFELINAINGYQQAQLFFNNLRVDDDSELIDSAIYNLQSAEKELNVKFKKNKHPLVSETSVLTL